jgi:serine/threonine protein kinase
MHRYEPSGRIGRGTYGEVWRATDVQTNRIVALKRIKLLDVDEGIPGTALREVSWLVGLHHNLRNLHLLP